MAALMLDHGGWRLNERKPSIGDLVCWSRESGIDYDHQNRGDYKEHCDVVVVIGPDSLDVIPAETLVTALLRGLWRFYCLRFPETRRSTR